MPAFIINTTNHDENPYMQKVRRFLESPEIDTGAVSALQEG